MFLTPLIISPSKPDYWVLDAPLGWSDTAFGTIVVPQGFETDLASIPWALTSLRGFEENGISRRPAVLHDYLYTAKTTTKEFADRLLQAAMIAEGSSRVVAWCFYQGVHLFGESAWKGSSASSPV